MILFKNNKSKTENFISVYLLTLFGIFPLYLTGETLQDTTFRLLLFCFLTGTAAVVYIAFLLKGRAACRKRLCRMDVCLLALLLLSVWQIVRRAIQGRGGYEVCLLASMCVLTYFVLSAGGGTDRLFRESMMDLFLISCAPVYAALFVKYCAVPQLRGPIALLTEDAAARKAFLILSCTACILQYCANREKKKDRLYLASAAAGFFLLFLQKDLMGILLLCGLFLLVPLLFVPTVELVRRDLILAFLFLFLLSSMPLLVNDTKLLKTEVRYSLEGSIELDLLLAAAGAAVLSYWDRVPKEIPPDAVVMKRMQKIFRFILWLCGILLAAVLCIGSLEGLEGRMGIGIIHYFSQELGNALTSADGTFGQTLREYGSVGLILAAAAYSVMITRLKKNYDGSRQSAALTAYGVMFLAQSLFYRQQAVTTPLYAALVTMALFYKKPAEQEEDRTIPDRDSEPLITGLLTPRILK